MAGESAALAVAANTALGIFLFALALLIYRTSPDRAARMPLAGYLVLVAANYMIDGTGWLATRGGVPTGLGYVALVPVLLDPPLLVAFALAVTGHALTRTRLTMLVVPTLLVVTMFIAFPPSSPRMFAWSLWPLYVVSLLGYYSTAFVLMGESYLRERRTLQRDRMGALVIAFGIVVLTRIPLLYVDLAFNRKWPHLTAPALILGLATITLVTLLAGRALVPRENAGHALRTAKGLSAGLAVVAGAWALHAISAFREGAFAILFSVRWFVFAGVFAAAIRRYDLLALSGGARRWVDRAIIAIALLLGMGEVAAVLAGLPDMSGWDAVFASAAVVGVAATAFALLRQVDSTHGDVENRRASLYRAHIELGATPEALEALRVELDIAPRTARRLRDLVALEQRTPKLAAAKLEEGAILLGRYQVEHFIGAGSFGRAFRGWDRASGTRIVLKELAPAWRSDPTALRAFRDEAAVALRVAHPNLVGFVALERFGDGHLLVLEHIEGQTLRDRLRSGPLEPAEVDALLRATCAALTALHTAGIIHRDVKPENIILHQTRGAVLLDFGAALSGDGTRQAKVHAGTRAYMSPEQAAGESLTPSSDVYALGLVAWEALTGVAHPGGRVEAPWDRVLGSALARTPEARVIDGPSFVRMLDEAVPRAPR